MRQEIEGNESRVTQCGWNSNFVVLFCAWTPISVVEIQICVLCCWDDSSVGQYHSCGSNSCFDPPDVRRAKGVQQIVMVQSRAIHLWKVPLVNSLHYSSIQVNHTQRPPDNIKQQYLNNAEESESVSFGEHTHSQTGMLSIAVVWSTVCSLRKANLVWLFLQSCPFPIQ